MGDLAQTVSPERSGYTGSVSSPSFHHDHVLGKDISELQGPAAVVDAAVVRHNCKLMLDCADTLGLSFRAHVKTHKTVEVTRFQVGDAPRPVKIVVSTVAEALHLLPYLTNCHHAGREISVLYGIPPASNSFERLLPLRTVLGSSSVAFLIDHPTQLKSISQSPNLVTSQPVPLFLKIDTGYHRAGVAPDHVDVLLAAISGSKDGNDRPLFKLVGLYSHLGSSYGNNSPEESMEWLCQEIDELNSTAVLAAKLGFDERLTLSVGATPTVTSAQNLLHPSMSKSRLATVIQTTNQNYDLELHAGVYPFLDMQQIATHARPTEATGHASMSTSDIAFTIMAEVLSVYGNREKPEALIGAGSLALGREPCKSYPGWGIMASSPLQRGNCPIYDEKTKTGWIVGRISQEHGILTWEGPQEHLHELSVGDRVSIWPNHACIAGSHFEHYFVFDSSKENRRIRDTWERCSGW